MGAIFKGIPKELILAIQKDAYYEIFVETGTYLGDTVIWAAAYFKKAYSIEILASLSKEASLRKDCPENIEFLIGNSKSVLKSLVSTFKAKALFWLDGHYSGNGTGGEDNECPILEELKAISTLQDSIILIDDARFFLGPPPTGHNSQDWPRLDEIIAKISTLFPKHKWTIHDDVIIIFPETIKPIIDENWVKNFNTRYSTPIEKNGFIRKLLAKF